MCGGRPARAQRQEHVGGLDEVIAQVRRGGPTADGSLTMSSGEDHQDEGDVNGMRFLTHDSHGRGVTRCCGGGAHPSPAGGGLNPLFSNKPGPDSPAGAGRMRHRHGEGPQRVGQGDQPRQPSPSATMVRLMPRRRSARPRARRRTGTGPHGQHSIARMSMTRTARMMAFIGERDAGPFVQKREAGLVFHCESRPIVPSERDERTYRGPMSENRRTSASTPPPPCLPPCPRRGAPPSIGAAIPSASCAPTVGGRRHRAAGGARGAGGRDRLRGWPPTSRSPATSSAWPVVLAGGAADAVVNNAGGAGVTRSPRARQWATMYERNALAKPTREPGLPARASG